MIHFALNWRYTQKRYRFFRYKAWLVHQFHHCPLHHRKDCDVRIFLAIGDLSWKSVHNNLLTNTNNIRCCKITSTTSAGPDIYKAKHRTRQSDKFKYFNPNPESDSHQHSIYSYLWYPGLLLRCITINNDVRVLINSDFLLSG